MCVCVCVCEVGERESVCRHECVCVSGCKVYVYYGGLSETKLLLNHPLKSTHDQNQCLYIHNTCFPHNNMITIMIMMCMYVYTIIVSAGSFSMYYIHTIQLLYV